MRPFVLFSSTFFKIFITSLLLFHSHFRIRNIIKWPTSLPMLGNKYQLPISPISILSRSTRPREKREGGREKFERRVSITDIPSRGSRNDEMIKQTRSGHCIVTYVRHYHFALVNANVRPDSGECIVPPLPSPSPLCCTDERFVRGPHVRAAL